MIKKLFFMATIATSLVASNDVIKQIEIVQNQITNIEKAKQAILAELRDTLVIGRKAKFVTKNILGDIYVELKGQVKNTIDRIFYSQEFIKAINDLINYQVHCICQENIAFEDIIYNNESASLIRKVDLELEEAFPELDEKTNTFFNILYITRVNSRGCKLLLDRLEKEEKHLRKLLS